MTEQVQYAASELGGTKAACDALGVSRATYYRQRKPKTKPPRPAPARKLSDTERAIVLETLNSDRFVDQAPAQVHASLLEDGQYLCSTRTMYRILEENEQVKERRNQLRHPHYEKPELLATAPNELWSWDITKLRGPVKWTYYYLYVILDVFSRYVVGWMLAESESAQLARRLIEETCDKESVTPGQLILHADRGSAMKSKLVAQLLGDLGVTKTHSRPHVSDDNPFSESNFKTLKYRPDFPTRFGSMEDALQFCRRFFEWYNERHHHSGIHFLTPAQVHHGEASTVLANRQATLNAAYAAHPERFPHGPPRVRQLASEVWINPPQSAIHQRETSNVLVRSTTRLNHEALISRPTN